MLPATQTFVIFPLSFVVSPSNERDESTGSEVSKRMQGCTASSSGFARTPRPCFSHFDKRRSTVPSGARFTHALNTTRQRSVTRTDS